MVDKLDLDQQMERLRQSVQNLNPGMGSGPTSENQAKKLVKQGSMTPDEAHQKLADFRKTEIKDHLISQNKAK